MRGCSPDILCLVSGDMMHPWGMSVHIFYRRLTATENQALRWPRRFHFGWLVLDQTFEGLSRMPSTPAPT